MSKSLTQSVFYIHAGLNFLEVAVNEVPNDRMRKAQDWVRKLKWIEDDIYRTLTPEGKEVFKKEVHESDSLVFASIVQLMLKMDEQERDFLERLATGIISGNVKEVQPIDVAEPELSTQNTDNGTNEL